MTNPRTGLLAHLPTDQAIQILKEEATPQFKMGSGCNAKADKTVLDDWDDPCTGYQCRREEGHTGNHMASDGANGWVYFSNAQVLKEKPKEEKVVGESKGKSIWNKIFGNGNN